VAVLGVTDLTPEVFLLRTERNGFPFVAGQNVGISEHLVYHRSKDFSICSSSGEADFIEFMIKENKAGTISPMLRRLPPGAKLDLTGPYGEFFHRQEWQGRQIFLATGIGISPFLSFLRSGPVENYLLVHGVRKAADLKLADGVDPAHYVSCISRELGGTYRGRITAYLESLELRGDDLFYICGNPLAAKEIHDLLQRRGVPDDRIIREFYYAYCSGRVRGAPRRRLHAAPSSAATAVTRNPCCTPQVTTAGVTSAALRRAAA
jgi:ferredoxin-NADP reductase